MDFLDLIHGWNSMKLWQKVLGVIFVALVILNLSFELGRNMGVVHSQDNIVHAEIGGNVPSNTTHFVDDEFLNGSGQIFTLAHAPNPPNSLKLYRNGVLQTEGPENNYILSGDSITLVTPKDKWDQFVASYRY